MASHATVVVLLLVLSHSVAGSNVWGFTPSDTTFIRSRFAVPGSASQFDATDPGLTPSQAAARLELYGTCSVVPSGDNLGHWDDMLVHDTSWGFSYGARNIRSSASSMRENGVRRHYSWSDGFSWDEAARVETWRRYTATNIDGATEVGSVSDLNSAVADAGVSHVVAAPTWKAHAWIDPARDKPGSTPGVLNHFARHVTSTSTGKYVASSGRPPTASYCFMVNIKEFAAATDVPVEAQPTVLAFKDQMRLAHAHGASVAWRWAAERFEARRQVRDAPHAIDAQLARQRAGNATGQQGYPAGGLPWSAGPYWATNPDRQVDPVGRGGAAYEYGPVAWDAPAGLLVYHVFEYADGDVMLGSMTGLDGFISEAESLTGITFGEATAMDGGVLKDTVFPAPVLPVTVEDVREVIGKTEVEWSWKKFKFVEVYDDDLIDETVARINDRVDNYEPRTAELYGAQYSSVLGARYPWGVIETCRSDAPGMSCEAAAGGSTVHDAVFDITCVAPRRTFKVARCEANETVATAIETTIYNRGAREYDFDSRVTEQPSPTYSRTCHHAFSVCYRGIRAGGYGFASVTCGRRKALGEPCGPFVSTGRGGSTLQVRHSIPATAGWVDVRTGSPYCYLGKGGPGCSKTCGNLYDADMHGRRRAFPHERCTAVDWSSCAGDPADGVNCTLNTDCTASADGASGDNVTTFAPRNQGCNRHGKCFTDEDPGSCVCGANVEGRFCDKCVDGYYGYHASILPVAHTYSTAKCGIDMSRVSSRVDRLRYSSQFYTNSDLCNVDGPLSRTPLSASARDNATLLDPEFLYAGTGADLGGGRRRLSDIVVDEDELTPAQVEAITDSGADMEWLYTQPGRGAILRPPVVNQLGCSGSCWGWRPEDGVTDDLAVHGTATYAWNPVGSTGRFSLRDSCGVAVVTAASDGELVGGPAYDGAVESFAEIATRCGLDTAGTESMFLARARACRATPVATDVRVLQTVCNFEETTCRVTTLGTALVEAGHTPREVFGCPSGAWSPTVATTPHTVQWPVPETAPVCTALAMDDAVEAPRDATSTGGWHADQLYCENVNTECVIEGEAYGTAIVDPDTSLSTGRRDLHVDENGDMIYATSPCDSCGPMHINEVLRSRGPEIEGVGAWAACPDLCDPAVFFAHSAVPGGVWETGANAGRRRGVVPSRWLGCPTLVTALPGSNDTVLDGGDDGGVNSTASLTLDEVSALIPPRWVSDWRQCLPEHFYADDGEASRLHVGDPHGYTSSSTPDVGVTVPSDWLPVFSLLWPANSTTLRVDAEEGVNGTTCSWTGGGDGDGSARNWDCTYTVRLCNLMADEGPVCGDVPRPVWQYLNGITPQSVLGCSSLWRDADVATRARTVLESQTPYARDDPDGHLCNPSVFAQLNTGDVVAAPTADDNASVASIPAVSSPGIGLDIRTASLGGVSLPVLPPLSPESTPAYTCSDRGSVFAVRPAVHNDSSVILGHMCGGPGRAATCSAFDPGCTSTYPLCSPGSLETCGCHDVRGCDGCRPGSNLDPARNCVECKPRHVWVENGAFDTCEFIHGCYASPGEAACSGHGSCIMSATRPAWDEPLERQRVVYAEVPESGVAPFQATDGYTDVKTRCVCGTDATGPFCSINTTACWTAGHVGAGGPPASSGPSDLGYSGATAPNMTTVNDTRVPGGRRPVGAVACRAGMKPELSQPGGCSRESLVILTQTYSVLFDWLAKDDNFNSRWFKVLPYEDGRLVYVDRTYRDSLLWIYQMPREELPPELLDGWNYRSPRCSDLGGRTATAEEFMKATLWQRRVVSRFYDWSGERLAELAAAGHDVTYRSTWVECMQMASAPGPGVTVRTFGIPLGDDAQLDMMPIFPASSMCTSMLPAPCIVDTCATTVDSSLFIS